MEIIEGHIRINPPIGVPIWDVDPYDPAILANPTEFYSGLRSKGAFVYIPKYSIIACGRYAETKEVFSDWERFVSSRGVGMDDLKYTPRFRATSLILETEPPYHDKVKAIMLRALGPKSVNTLKTLFLTYAEELVDSLIKKGSFDVVSDFAEVFISNTFPKVMGMKATDTNKLLDFGSIAFNSIGPNNEIRQKALEKAPETGEWIANACKEENFESTGFGAIMYEAAQNGEITLQEAADLVRPFLTAGLDTTITSIGNSLWCLIHFPAAFEALKVDPTLAKQCFEEVLRYTSPVMSSYRTATETTAVANVKIEKDTKILCVLGSANLDETHWENANEFDIHRKPFGHLAFGVGIHQCVGQMLARIEMEAVITAIANKVEKIELIEAPVWRLNNAMHLLERMVVRFYGK